jgi:MFS superfamily sulfate permease-like transporter
VLSWIKDYRRGWLRPDLLAALTVWAVLVPESLAYATIAGVPPVVGLYAAVPALILYDILTAATGDVHAIILDAEAIPLVDVTAATMLAELARELHTRGVELHLAHDVGQVRDMLHRAGISLPHVHATIDDAIHTAT